MDTNQTPDPISPAPAQDAQGNFIPPPIKGYQKLSPEQLELLNRVKALGEKVESEIAHFVRCGHCEEIGELDTRAVAIARTEFQTAFMWLCRSIAKPTTFA